MKKYRCTICGYIYDEAVEKVKFSDLPDDWTCPLCGALKSSFEEILEETKDETFFMKETEKEIQDEKVEVLDDDMRKLSAGELSAICSNLSRACEKQYLERESELFKELANYYKDKVSLDEQSTFQQLAALINEDLKNFPIIMEKVREKNDRGSLRSLTWGEKVTRILSSIIQRYAKSGIDIIKNTNIYVCDICGFVYFGEKVPDICPVCKVPSLKIIKMERK